MQLGSLKKFTMHTAGDVAAVADFSDEAKPLIVERAPIKSLIAKLVEEEMWPDALKVFAYALPKREAVWWACTCARQSLTKPPDPADAEIIKASEAWVYRPTDKNRRAAMELAEATEFNRAAHWTAAGAFWSGGSISQPDLPAVEPAETMTATAVFGSVMLAAVQPEAEEAEAKFKRFLAQAANIADGGDGRSG